ncbi:hypothetical protein SISNIDRAFT_467582 [Sistotremastrum niveocremeum HHB9708]|uniref:Uncharacterized protein n=1 Tax=Sistotremastrum niveocremeum HHB9708 TaxID=1314777 RepID=A0A164SNC1_9AGAM|nr:hypothetical protein SISNIDRAFT_467582 [Sistotremastrum niveocremeum HHB9708]
MSSQKWSAISKLKQELKDIDASLAHNSWRKRHMWGKYCQGSAHYLRRQNILDEIEELRNTITVSPPLPVIVDLEGYESAHSSESFSSSCSSSASASSRESSPEPYIPVVVQPQTASNSKTPARHRGHAHPPLKPRRGRGSRPSNFVRIWLASMASPGEDQGLDHLVDAFGKLGVTEQQAVLDEMPELADALEHMSLAGHVSSDVDEHANGGGVRGAKARRTTRLRGSLPY